MQPGMGATGPAHGEEKWETEKYDTKPKRLRKDGMWYKGLVRLSSYLYGHEP